MCGTKKDQVHLLGPPGPTGVPALRRVGGEVIPCLLKQQKEGSPIVHEFIKLTSTNCPIVYDCETMFDPRDPEGAQTGGPAKVNSEAFKTGWDTIFGKTDLVN